MTDDDVRRAAMQIMPELSALLDQEAAESLGTRLRDALRHDAATGSAEIRQLLTGHAATREWMRERLRGDPDDLPNIRGYQELPGLSPVIPGEPYACPVCGSTWSRPSIDDPVPPCEVHQIPRVRAGG
jgi:hypothetical protein